MSSDVDCGDLRGYDANERNVLIYVHTFSDEVLTKPPHFISAEVLILERKLYVVRFARVFVELGKKLVVELQTEKLRSRLGPHLRDGDFSVVPDAEHLGDIARDRYLERV